MTLTLPGLGGAVGSGPVESVRPAARKATLDDLPALHALWQRAGLPWNELERFLTEFQVVPGDDGMLLAAIGLQIDGQEALIHSEALFPGYSEDDLRASLWSRLQIVARNQGVVRLWTLEDAPYWLGTFTAADSGAIQRLQASFRDPTAAWRCYQLLDPERAQKLVDERLAMWDANLKSEKSDLLDTVQRIRTFAFVFAAIVIGGILLLIVFVVLRQPHLIQRILNR
jgi:N-acetylglutamate synthase-like GNAT family acetyltransferase